MTLKEFMHTPNPYLDNLAREAESQRVTEEEAFWEARAKEEAIKRMRALGIISDAIKQFAEKDIVMVSEPPLGGLFCLDDEEKKMVQDFEQKYNALVYLVVRSYTNIGKMDSIFYVSDYQFEWFMDDTDIDEGYACVYVVNYDMPDCSEFGEIQWKSIGGGVLRIF